MDAFETLNERDPPHAADAFASVSALANDSPARVLDREWSVPAGSLCWTCWQTVDHVVDCLVSYAMQLSARAKGDFLPFQEFRARPDASPAHLVQGLGAAGGLFSAVLRSVPAHAVASDGLIELGVTDWAQRGAYEVLLHTYDVMSGLAGAFDPPMTMCAWVVGSPSLWMLDRERAEKGNDPWTALLLGSGRTVGSAG